MLLRAIFFYSLCCICQHFNSFQVSFTAASSRALHRSSRHQAPFFISASSAAAGAGAAIDQAAMERSLKAPMCVTRQSASLGLVEGGPAVVVSSSFVFQEMPRVRPSVGRCAGGVAGALQDMSCDTSAPGFGLTHRMRKLLQRSRS